MEYKIKSVESFSEQTYGQYGNHRAMVTLEGDKKVSAFLKTKPNIGDVWNGEIKEVEKDGKKYINFEFAKKDDKVMEVLQKIRDEQVTQNLQLSRIEALLTPKKHESYEEEYLGEPNI